MNYLQKGVRFLSDRVQKKIYRTTRDIADDKHRKAHAAEYAEIDRLITDYMATLNLTQTSAKKNQTYKLWVLKRLLEKHQPENILEFGSGSSSVIVADYARKNGAKFTTVDENKDWAEQTATVIAKEGDETVQVLYREKITDLTQSPPSICYAGTFDGAYDFVFIDGPSLAVNGKTMGAAANKDVFGLNPLPKVIVVDGRQSTAMLVHTLYGDKYSTHLSDLFKRGYIKNDYNYLSVFVRKD